MTLTIPVWLLWTCGAAALVVLLFLAALGVMHVLAMRAFNEVFGRHFGW